MQQIEALTATQRSQLLHQVSEVLRSNAEGMGDAYDALEDLGSLFARYGIRFTPTEADPIAAAAALANPDSPYGTDYRCPVCGAPDAHVPGGNLCAELSMSGDATNTTTCSCSEENGPCETHAEVLAQREGASVRTADELLVTFVEDCRDIDAACLSPAGRDILARAHVALQRGRDERSGVAWFADENGDEDENVREEMRDLARQLEGYFADLWITWEDGYVIARVTGGPLAEHSAECVECEHDCPLRPGRGLQPLGAPFCSICDDHSEAVHADDGNAS